MGKFVLKPLENSLLILIVLAVAYIPIYPTVNAESTLEYAVFDYQNKILNLTFNKLPVHDNIFLKPDGADSFLPYDIRNQQNILLDDIKMEQFRDITCPTLRVKTNNASISNYSVPLWVVHNDDWTPPRPGIDVSCTLTYKIIETQFTPNDDQLNIVHVGLKEWSKLNPGLEMQYIKNGTANININFTEIDDAGQACTNCIYTLATKYVNQPCSKRLEPPNEGALIILNYKLSGNSLQNTIIHEFGHNLGLCHHPSKDNVMSNTGLNDAQYPYDDLGYNIPEKIIKSNLALIASIIIIYIGIVCYIMYYKSLKKKKAR